MNDVPAVKIDLSVERAKYVVAELGDSYFVWSDGKAQYHKDIVAKLVGAITRARGGDACKRLKILGGGKIWIFSNHIELSSESHQYGAESDRFNAAALVKRHYPEYFVRFIEPEKMRYVW